MKKIISLILSICIISALFTFSIGAVDGEKKSYLALGDSITAGYGIEDVSKTFTNILAEKEGFSLINHAVSGDTTTDLLSKVGEKEVAEEIKKADVITITIGGNDFMGAFMSFVLAEYKKIPGNEDATLDGMMTAFGSGNTDILTFASGVVNDFAKSSYAADAEKLLSKNLSDVLKNIRSSNKDATVIVARQYNPYSYLKKSYGIFYAPATTISDAFDVGVKSLNGVIDTLQNSSGIKFLTADVYSKFESAVASNINPCNPEVKTIMPLDLNLDFHPNETGHALIAECISDVIANPTSGQVNGGVQSSVSTDIPSSTPNGTSDCVRDPSEETGGQAENVVTSSPVNLSETDPESVPVSKSANSGDGVLWNVASVVVCIAIISSVIIVLVVLLVKRGKKQ